MTTRLEGPLKREVEIGGIAYTLTITPQGLKLVLKGKKTGFELDWDALVSGDAALATALNASLTARLQPVDRSTKPSSSSPGKSGTRKR